MARFETEREETLIENLAACGGVDGPVVVAAINKSKSERREKDMRRVVFNNNQKDQGSN